ncbi:helix-turn-helix domain-containing protein (plasmid) [Nitratireductor rhodophyticola]|jgi:DNA-binding transcriptional MerR regulator|uniref:Helix-turn-helix domain-containing protein n=1 Tax=Nitratireductor rhodophyticola TaxID=2854036 RepID=A0ABS7REY3_9HYPH|nr:helix-turn-helix domain-containing protein [Nitratireductor rhodophyticola]MAS15422.1 MerR family transcriptional regulator [Nitratireductor sp.]MBY8918967.1 helix-turn-helix domain-containing protein [Nitratireductor rhodophyticola]MEC9245882.1 helix-turn-helix domain-containing protein [Pseudomonadota bacterium]MBY8922978.1 helix-turn-helix domain-containing protein [Nitratireductor rhodophyticola]WPZ16404.1 helix-turn-helix domain-containing protein [Nitratireductor rhodophyticola]
MPALKIGDLATRTGTNAPTIRYYEEIGLIPRADRQDGGQRRYGDEDVKRLTLIRRCRAFGFPIEQVRSLVALAEEPGRSCLEARDLAQEHLTTVRAKLRELKALEQSLARFVESCETACAGGPGPDCTILKDLAKPSGQARTASEAGRPARRRRARR